ncbi:MAG: hypothetical protein R3F11_04335 [Verrucomicrobiales bacterium]
MNGKRSVGSFHRELGLLCWDKCGMARTKAGLEEALQRIPQIRAEFWERTCASPEGEPQPRAGESATASPTSSISPNSW